MHFPTMFAAALTLLSSAAHATVTNDDLSRDPHTQTKQIIEVIEEVFAGEPPSVVSTITRICMCESGGRNQHGKPIGTIIHIEPNGGVREGDTIKEDTGACQINPTMHSRAWKQANGFNPQVAEDIVGNIRYARALIQDKRDRKTSHPLGIWEDWGPSHSCWK